MNDTNNVPQTKYLIIGSKMYQFEGEDLYSPKTSNMADANNQPFFFPTECYGLENITTNENYLQIPREEHNSNRPIIEPSISVCETRSKSFSNLNLVSIWSECDPCINFKSMIECNITISIESIQLVLDLHRCYLLNSSNRTKPMYSSLQQRRRSLSDCDHVDDCGSPVDSRTKQQLLLHNLYLDELKVQTLLYNYMDKFKRTLDWPRFVTKYHNLHQTIIDQVSCYLNPKPYFSLVCIQNTFGVS